MARAQTDSIASVEPREDRARPPYEPPRLTKRRSVARATLFTGSGPTAGGLIGNG